MKISFHSCANNTNFHVKSFAPSLAFIVRFTATRKNGLLCSSFSNRKLLISMMYQTISNSAVNVVVQSEPINFSLSISRSKEMGDPTRQRKIIFDLGGNRTHTLNVNVNGTSNINCAIFCGRLSIVLHSNLVVKCFRCINRHFR